MSDCVRERKRTIRGKKKEMRRSMRAMGLEGGARSQANVRRILISKISISFSGCGPDGRVGCEGGVRTLR
jgi:hypothetical protein